MWHGKSETCQAGSTVRPHTQTTVVTMIEKGISKVTDSPKGGVGVLPPPPPIVAYFLLMWSLECIRPFDVVVFSTLLPSLF